MSARARTGTGPAATAETLFAKDDGGIGDRDATGGTRAPHGSAASARAMRSEEQRRELRRLKTRMARAGGRQCGTGREGGTGVLCREGGAGVWKVLIVWSRLGTGSDGSAACAPTACHGVLTGYSRGTHGVPMALYG